MVSPNSPRSRALVAEKTFAPLKSGMEMLLFRRAAPRWEDYNITRFFQPRSAYSMGNVIVQPKFRHPRSAPEGREEPELLHTLVSDS